MKQIHSLSYKAGFLLFANGFRGLSSLFLYMILSRALSQDDYGSYRQIWLLVTIFSQIVIFGLPSSITFFVSGKEKQERYFYQAVFMILLSSVAQLGLIILFKNEIGRLFNNSELPLLLMSSLPLFLLFPFTHLISPSLVAKGFYKSSAFLSILYSVLILGGIFVGILVLPDSFTAIKYFTIAILIYVIFALIVTIRKFPFRFLRFSFASIYEQFKYSLPLGLAISVELISKFTDKIIVSNAVSTADFSIFVNGAFEIPFVSLISGAAMAILFPEFVKYYRNHNFQEIAVRWKNSIRKTSTFLIPTMVFFLTFPRETMVSMYSTTYANSTNIFFLYLFILPLRVTIISQVISAFNKNRLALKAILVGLLLNLTLTYFLVKYFGMAGAPIGTIVSLYMINIYLLSAVKKELNVTYASLLPVWHTLKLLILSVTIALAVRILLPASIEVYIYLILAALIFFSSVAAVVITGKVVSW